MNIFKDKKILITGGTGSFGHRAVLEFLKHRVKEVLVFSRDEEKQLDMRRQNLDKRLNFIIGNVRDYESLIQATKNIDIVYHAAALKIIPVCEKHPRESLKTNLLGTLNVKDAALENRVHKSIFVNTDKAVQPINVYGACKMLSEKMWIHGQTEECKFSSVRYGNVIGSRGSVVPFFRQLIADMQPIPITDVRMTRFLLTLKQAIQTVVYATENMHGGEVFVPKLSSCKIMDLVRALASSSYPIKIVGTRPGEKIHETLISEEEFRRTEEQKKCYIIHPHGTFKSEKKHVEYSSKNANRMTIGKIRKVLRNCD